MSTPRIQLPRFLFLPVLSAAARGRFNGPSLCWPGDGGPLMHLGEIPLGTIATTHYLIEVIR